MVRRTDIPNLPPNEASAMADVFDSVERLLALRPCAAPLEISATAVGGKIREFSVQRESNHEFSK